MAIIQRTHWECDRCGREWSAAMGDDEAPVESPVECPDCAAEDNYQRECNSDHGGFCSDAAVARLEAEGFGFSSPEQEGAFREALAEWITAKLNDMMGLTPPETAARSPL